MDRRTFLGTLAGGLLAAPLAAEAQQGRIVTLGYLSPAAGRNAVDESFEQALREFGWETGRSIRIDARYSAGRQDKVRALVQEALGGGVDILVTYGPPLAREAKRATSDIPVVFLTVSEPIGEGLVTSLAHPGGNMTGVLLSPPEVYGKRLELLKEAVPGLTRVVVLQSTEFQGSGVDSAIAAAAKALGLKLFNIQVEAPANLESAFRKARDHGAQAVFVRGGGFFFSFAGQVADLALANRLPCASHVREGAMAGALFAYGPNLAAIARQGAALVDKILRGRKPADLPVEEPTKFELVINLKTAKALGLTIPPSLLQRADQVIE